ncbi:MAG: hypothetical protein FWG00_06215 [Coriobacteriia bacterium]|nr:hypothetical protein [Coriobacteriia bacterium]
MEIKRIHAPKQPAMQHIIFVLLSCLLVVASVLSLTAQNALAEQDEPNELIVIGVPELQWSDLDAQTTPTLFALAQNSALANMNAPFSNLKSRLHKDPNITFYYLSVDLSLEYYDEEVALLLNTINDNYPDTQPVVAVVSATAFSEKGADRAWAPTIINGPGFSGFTTSESTHRPGFLRGSDLFLLSEQLRNAALSEQPAHHYIGSTGFSDTSNGVGAPSNSSANSLEARIGVLEHKAITIAAVTDTKPLMGLFFLLAVFATFGLSILLLIIGHTEKKGSRDILVPLVRILWLVVLSYPPATFLMFLFVPNAPSGEVLMLICGLWTVAIALAALLVGRRTRWVNSLFFLLLLSITVIACGQIFGGPLYEPGYLTYDATDGSRYYGMGNEQGAIFFGAWFTFSGLLVNRFPKLASIRAFKRWGFVVGSLLLLFVACAPWLGASFGPLVWGVFGVVLMWLYFNGFRVRWWVVLLVLLFAAALALGVLYIDIEFNTLSHMRHYESSLDKGLSALIPRVLETSWNTSIVTIVEYMPLPAILFFLLVVAFLVVLRTFKPGTYRAFWGRNRAYGATYVVGLYIAFITFCLEDSGLFTPAVFLLYPLSGFVWLVCDMHSWHLRELAAEGSKPLTIRQLLHRAFVEETYHSELSPLKKSRSAEKKLDEADKVSNADRAGKADRVSKTDKASKAERASNANEVSKADRTGKADRARKTDRKT